MLNKGSAVVQMSWF